jgi:hypothetical protein
VHIVGLITRKQPFLSYFLILADLQSDPALVAGVRRDRSALAVGDTILQVTEQQLAKEIKPGAIFIVAPCILKIHKLLKPKNSLICIVLF